MSIIQRFVGIDLHKHYVVVAAVDGQQELLLNPRRISLDTFQDWVEGHLTEQDAVVLEATGNAWYLHDLVAPFVGRCVVANPREVKLIAAALVKTDRHDAIRLAKLLAANIIPEVWVPPVHVRELRALISHRRQVVKQQTAAKNRLQSVLHRHHVLPPPGKLFAEKNRAWWHALDLPVVERLRIQQDLATLAHTAEQLAVIEDELARLSTGEHWADQVPYLIQLPGFGLLTTMTVLGAIGDITRFARAKRLVGYAGLGAGVHDSGETHRDKGITKQGRRDLRRVMVEAAWTAVQVSSYWKGEFERLTVRKHKHPNVAIVAIARRMLVAVWHVLTERVADRNAVPEMVAFKLMIWSWKLTDAQRGGLSSRQFVRYGLLRLELGEDLTHIITGTSTRRAIAPPAEVLDLFPELRDET